MAAMANYPLLEQLDDVSTTDARKQRGVVPHGLAEGLKEGMASRQGLSPTSATPCHTPRPSNPALTRNPGQDPPMPPPPSPTYERLRDFIARRMRMGHVDQLLMLMELMGHGLARQQPAPPRRRA